MTILAGFVFRNILARFRFDYHYRYFNLSSSQSDVLHPPYQRMRFLVGRGGLGGQKYDGADRCLGKLWKIPNNDKHLSQNCLHWGTFLCYGRSTCSYYNLSLTLFNRKIINKNYIIICTLVYKGSDFIPAWPKICQSGKFASPPQLEGKKKLAVAAVVELLAITVKHYRKPRRVLN